MCVALAHACDTSQIVRVLACVVTIATVSSLACECMCSPVSVSLIQVIDERLSDMTEAERRMASEPGLTGRIWDGQAMVFDEGYGILMMLGILSDPKQAWCVSSGVVLARACMCMIRACVTYCLIYLWVVCFFVISRACMGMIRSCATSRLVYLYVV